MKCLITLLVVLLIYWLRLPMQRNPWKTLMLTLLPTYKHQWESGC